MALRNRQPGAGGHGQPLRIDEIEPPEPGPQDVVLDIAYSGVNPVDLNAAQAQVAADARVPRTLGTEGAGTVDGRPVMVRGHGIGRALADGQLSVPVDLVLPLEEVNESFDLIRRRQVRGKIVLTTMAAALSEVDGVASVLVGDD